MAAFASGELRKVKVDGSRCCYAARLAAWLRAEFPINHGTNGSDHFVGNYAIGGASLEYEAQYLHQWLDALAVGAEEGEPGVDLVIMDYQLNDGSLLWHAKEGHDGATLGKPKVRNQWV